MLYHAHKAFSIVSGMLEALNKVTIIIIILSFFSIANNYNSYVKNNINALMIIIFTWWRQIHKIASIIRSKSYTTKKVICNLQYGVNQI